MSTRQNQWFVPGDGIAREVITADIQRYLGPDALVRPGTGTGEYEGRSGYWITAYRTLTTQMILDLRSDSTRWQQEQGRLEPGRGVAYQDSRTHAARQHWGPSESHGNQRPEREQPRASHTQAAYQPTDQHYTTTPTYGSTHQAYQTTPQAPSAYAQPRTDMYATSYAQQPRQEQPGYGSAHAQYAYSHAAPADPYRAQPPPPQHAYQQQSQTPAPGYYFASDGRQYPLSQQPQQPQQPSRGRRQG